MSPSLLKLFRNLPLVLLIGLFIFHLSVITKHSVNLPHVDEWGLVSGDDHPASISLGWLYEQVNDHRTATTKLFVWLQYHLNGWNLRAQFVIDFLIYGVILSLLVLLAHRFCPQVPTWLVLGFLVFLLSPIIWVEHVWAYPIAIHFWLLFLIVGTYFLFADAQSWRAMGIGALALVLSTYSFAAGFATSLVLATVFTLFKIVRTTKASGKEARRREPLQLLAVVILVGGALVTWIAGYHQPPYIVSIAWPHTMRFWNFFLNLLSFGFGIDRLSRTLGAVCLLIILVPIVGEVWRRRGQISNGQWAVFGLSLALLADHAAITMGRASFGLGWSKVAEYPEHGMPLIVLSLLNWFIFLQDRRRLQTVFVVSFWFFCFVAFSNNWNFSVYAETNRERIANYECVRRYYEHTGDGHCRGTFGDYPHPEIILEQARRLNLSFYREMKENTNATKTGEEIKSADR